MASVCGGTLAMMDAGVPIKSPVAGIAMGLIMDEASGKYAVLTDIAGAEDHYGDMDFKVAGTAEGITALQMDIKVDRHHVRDHARRRSTQARDGRLHILGMMQQSLPATRANISAYAPRIVTIKIPVDKIRDVIGPGGKMIRSIIEKTGVKIDVEDDGQRQRGVGRRGRRRQSDRHDPGADRHARARTRPTSARCSASPTSAPSSRSCPAPTACCTSRRSRTTA